MLIFEACNVSKMKQAAMSLYQRLVALRSAGTTAVLAAGAWTQVMAQQVNDLPGGPAVNQLNFAPPATKIAEQQHWLHWFMLILCTVIFVLVFGVMFYSIVKHRRSVGHKSQELPEPIWVESWVGPLCLS